MMTAVRGRGLFIAFDLPDRETRDEVLEEACSIAACSF